MDLVGRFLRAIGIAQGAYFLWFTLGGGAVVTGVGAALLAAYSDFPWWAITIIGAGLFLIGGGVGNFLAAGVARRVAPQSEAYHALTNVIESGRRLRHRLSELNADPAEEERARWDLRLKTWQEDAEDVVQRVTPFRLAAFRVDVIISDYPGRRLGRPERVAGWELDVETTLERLLYIRVTL